MLGQYGVVLGTFDQMQKAGIRETCAGIDGDRVHDRLVASCYEYIGHRLVDRFSPRDGEKMLLAFAAGVRNQGVIVEPLGIAKDGPATSIESSNASLLIM